MDFSLDKRLIHPVALADTPSDSGDVILKPYSVVVSGFPLLYPDAIAPITYAGDTDQKQVLAVGFQKHNPKPIEPAELVAAIAKLVRCR